MIIFEYYSTRHPERSSRIRTVALALSLSFIFCTVSAAQEAEATPAPDPVSLFQKAQDEHEKGQFAAAIDLYDKAIAAVQDFPEAEYQRASALLSLGKTDEAEKGFRRAVKARPDWTLALANLGSLLVGKGMFQEAEPLLVKAVALDDQNTLAYSALTELRLASNAEPEELRGLLARLTAITGKARTPASAWAARAALETALGDKAAAAKSFDRALELDPNNQFALVSRANAALGEGDVRGSEGLLKRLETVAPGSRSVKALKARILVANGKADEALALLDSIQNFSPEIAALRDRIKLKESQNPAELEKLLEKNPKDAFVLGSLCSALRVSDPPKALAYCRRASEAEPGNLNHAVGYGAALVQAKNYSDAVAVLQRIKSAAPDNVTARANLATALFQLKRLPEAKAEYQWITEQQPANAAAYYFLAIVHDQLEEYVDAMANYQLFLRNADAEKQKVEIERVNLRLPPLQKQIKAGKGKKH